MDHSSLKLIQRVETFLMDNPAFAEFPWDHKVDRLLPDHWGRPEDNVQRFDNLLQRHPQLNSTEVLQQLIGQVNYFTLEYLRNRLRLSGHNDPLYTFSRLLYHLDTPAALQLVNLLRDISRDPIPPIYPEGRSRSQQLHIYTIAICSTIEQSLTPHLRRSQEPIATQIDAAFGSSAPAVIELLNQRPTLQDLLHLHEIAQKRVLEVMAQDWPPQWSQESEIMPPTLRVLTNVLGTTLLDYAESLTDFDTIRAYLLALKLPAAYLEPALPKEDDDDPLAHIPEDCQVDLPIEINEVYQTFLFSSPELAQVFTWFTSDRQRYSQFVDNALSLFADPFLAHTACSLRQVLLDNYAAPLPSDTFTAYLNLAHCLSEAPVPDDWQNGGLSLLHLEYVGTMTASSLAVILEFHDHLWWSGKTQLHFSTTPIHLYLVVADNSEETPAALILTANDTPGNPEEHRHQPHRTLPRSKATSILVLDSLSEAHPHPNLYRLTDLAEKYLFTDYNGSGKFTKSHRRYFLGLVDSCGAFAGPVTLYTISGGYMLQFDPRYTFAPTEMELDWDDTSKIKQRNPERGLE